MGDINNMESARKTLYLHIGTPKTGTTSIQEYMSYHPDYLARYGYAYPAFEIGDLNYGHVPVRTRNGHFLNSLHYDAEQEKKCLKQIYTMFEMVDNIVLSDEGLFARGGRNENFWIKLRDRLSEHGIRLVVVIYLRRQDDFLLSYWEQQVKGSITVRSTFTDFLDRKLYFRYDLDYYDYLMKVFDLIGRENVRVRVFERDQLMGPEHSAVTDFLLTIGIPLDGFEEKGKSEYRNETVSDSVLEMKRILNKIPIFRKGNENMVESQVALQQQRTKEGKIAKRTGFTPARRKKFMKQFTETNARVAREILGREDGVLFRDTSYDRGDEPAVFTPDELEENLRRFWEIAEETGESPYDTETRELICRKFIYRIRRKKDLAFYLRRMKKRIMWCMRAGKRFEKELNKISSTWDEQYPEDMEEEDDD